MFIIETNCMSLNLQDFPTRLHCCTGMLTTAVVVKLSNMSVKTSFKYIFALKCYFSCLFHP